MVQITDLHPHASAMLADVLEGLSRPQKEIPCKYLYDEEGSRLYDQICEARDYYPARTEVSIMRDNIGAIAEIIGPRCLLIEYGSGSSEKTEILFEGLEELAAYVPIDISREHLLRAARNIDQRYPTLEVLPVVADYTNHIELPTPKKPVARRVVYFPGSTIGNFDRAEAKEFLGRIQEICGANDGLLIGVDLRKDPQVLEAAYDDSEGATARFNLNLLSHINDVLGADFDVTKFAHRARYNDSEGRVEMHLVGTADQTVNIGEESFDFAEGEHIWTESSYKYTLEGFAELANECDFTVERVWTDADDRFSVQYLRGA